MKLWKRLGLNFIFIIITCILLTGIISNWMIDKRFDNYLYEQNRNRIEKIKGLINEVYIQDKSISSIEERVIMEFCLMENLSIEIEDGKGLTIFDSGKEHIMNNRMNSMMGKGMMRRSKSNFWDKFMEEKYDIKKGNEIIGKITVGYYGNFNITSKDAEFKSTLNKSFLISMSVALIFGLMFSFIFSKQLTSPILEVNDTAKEITKGNFKIRSKSNSNTLELKQLSNSINYLAESLDSQDMLRKRLTSDMAHEIRTPLTTLQNYIEAFLDGIWEPSNERLEECHEEILRLTKLVEGLKNISNLEEANLNLSKSRFNIDEETEKIVESFKPQFTKKNIEINFRNHLDNVSVIMDKDKYRQIIINLLSNAYRYTDERGQVNVILTTDGPNTKVIVQDSGIGISKEDIPYIFERFYRSDNSRDRSTGGTGIGLAIVKALVKAHGGTISVESEVNRGSKFTLEFPK